MATKLSDYIIQKDNDLFCKDDCELKIDLTKYSIDDNITIDEEESIIWVKNLMALLIYKEFEFDIILDYPVNINIEGDFEYVKKNYIKLIYMKGQKICSLTSETASVKEQIPYIERLLGGKELYKNSAHILRKLTAMGPFSGLDTVHLEVLISNCLRDSNDTSIPARLAKVWNPKLINIKEIVFSTSFIQGLEFENVGKAINTGLIQDDAPPSILEKIMTGELVTTK
jgi:hypothetical protein